jgi:superfamily II DNA/RNA helicase
MSQQSFADLGVSSAVARAREDRGFAAPFAIQTQGAEHGGKAQRFFIPMMTR